MTTTLYNIMRSELIKRGYNEFVDKEGNLIFFDSEKQFMTKILKYDEDVSEIIDDLFFEQSLHDPEYDLHFKKGFIYRFLNRRINRQTVESFRMELLATFLANEHFINTVYADLDKFIAQTATSDQENKQVNKQKSEQETDGQTTSDNRSAFAELPQNNVQIDVDNTVMTSASDNTISRNKQVNNQTNSQTTDGETSGETSSVNKTYQLDELLKTNGLMDQIYNIFDRKCFMQTW